MFSLFTQPLVMAVGVVKWARLPGTLAGIDNFSGGTRSFILCMLRIYDLVSHNEPSRHSPGTSELWCRCKECCRAGEKLVALLLHVTNYYL